MNKLIPKFQSPWTPINYKTPENFEPKSTKYNITNTPTILDVQDERTKQKHAQMSGMRHMLDTSQKEPVSGTDPVGEFIVAGEMLGGLNPLGKILFPYAARFTSGSVKNWIASKALNDVLSKDALTGGVNKVVQNNGNILLQLASHSSRKPRQLRIEPQGNNSFRVHASTWGGLTDIEKKQLYEALYKELPENAKILFPESNPDYLATRGTVASLLRLKRDPRFTPGRTLQKLMYKDKDGSIKFFEGTSFTKKPIVSSINYTSNQQQTTGKTSLKFFERSQSRISTQEKAGIPKGERNNIQQFKVANYPGWQLKSLMKGSPLERQLSKNGTININSLMAQVNKASKIEKEVINKVLQKKFAGQKVINYNSLKKATQDELITYERKYDAKSMIPTMTTEKMGAYGGDRLGIIKDFKDVPDGIGGLVTTWNRELPVLFKQFTFETPKISVGSRKHYSGQPIGHTRTFINQQEPRILHVMESQSDWAQGKLESPYKGSSRYLNDPREYKRFIDGHERLLKEMKENPSEYQDGAIAQQEANIAHHKRVLEQILNGNNDIQIKYLHDNYLQRQLQENLRYAAENGQTKMRYPTSETAAKIQGYKKQRVPNPIRDLETELYKQLNKMCEKYLNSHEPELRYMSSQEIKLELKNNVPGVSELLEKLDQLRNIPTNVYSYSPEHQTILKKYADFPKLFQKLYKGQNVRTVTDAKGNTWYEVDVPKGYLNREWQFKLGGKLIPKQ